MTTCPRCGRVADDEIVCAGCGMSLALARRVSAEESPGLLDGLATEQETDPGSAARDVKLWRLAALVCVICVLAATAAILLLHQHGSRHADLGQPLTTSAGGTAEPSASATPSADSAVGSARPGTTPATSTTGATPSRTRARATATQAAAHPTSAARATSSARTSSPAVQLARGATDPRCGPHCYLLVVTLSAFPGGQHKIQCWSQHAGLLATYTASAATSAGCSDRRPRDSAWAVVDGRIRSNTVTW